MNYSKLSCATQELAAYDEGIYPDGQYKPTGRRYKHNTKSNNSSEHRNQALVIACQTLIEYSQHQRLATPVVIAAYHKTAFHRANLDHNDQRLLYRFSSTKNQPNMFAHALNMARKPQSKGI
jgi:hypothetical protein